MTIYEYEEDKYIFAHKFVDLSQKYSSTYNHDNSYYSVDVWNIRENLVNKYVDDPTKIFDYGCGKKPYHNFNKNKIGGYWDKYTNGLKNFNRSKYNECTVITCWDVLEHILQLKEFLLMLDKDMIIATVPTVRNNKLKSLDDIRNWNHYKEGEHCIYATENGWKQIFNDSQWNVIYTGFDECPPRIDIMSIVAVR